MDIREITIELLKDLYASDTGLLPYTLYKRYGINPVELVQVVKRLQSDGVVNFMNDRLSLTKEGRDNAERLIAKLNLQRTHKESTFFVRIKGNKLEWRTPYIPSRIFYEQILKKEGVRNG